MDAKGARTKLENSADIRPAVVTRTLELSMYLCSLKRAKRKGCVRMVKETRSIDKGTRDERIKMRIIQSRRFNFSASASATSQPDSYLQR